MNQGRRNSVKLTHLPTGTTATCDSERSQHRNRDNALAVLKARLHAQTVGIGPSSEVVATYRLPPDELYPNWLDPHRKDHTKKTT